MRRSAVTPEWIVCQDATRVVERDHVRCPIRGRVAIAACLACRHLETSSNERSGGSWCEPGDPPDQRS